MTFALRIVLAMVLARFCFGQTFAKDGASGATSALTFTGELGKPALSVATRARLWRAVAEVNAVKGPYEAATAALLAAKLAAEAECGKAYFLTKDAAGEPSCAERPPEPKPEVKRPVPRK